jgi:hypothetical protein
LALTTLILASVGCASQSAYADYSLAPSIPPANSNANTALAGPTSSSTLSQEELTALSARAPDPYFQPKGIPLGGPFRLFTDLFTGVAYDSNVYRSVNAPKNDIFFDINPTVVLDYNTARLRLDLYGVGDFNEYTKVTQLDTSDYNFGLRGQYLISGASTATGSVSYAKLTEPLSSSSVTAGQQSPSSYNLFDANGQVSFKPNRLGITVGGSVDSYGYLNTTVGGHPFGNKDRDNNLYKGFTEVSYDFSPGYSAFIRGTYNNDKYRPGPDRAGILRSSHGFQVDGGVDLLLGNLIQGELYAGYVDQDYNHHQTFTLPADPLHTPRTLHDLSGLDFGANLSWYPTELLTVTLGASRQLQNTTLAGASAGDDRGVVLGANYELTRRIQLLAHAQYDDTFYKGTAIAGVQPNRDDKTLDLGLGGKWLISHYVYATLNYDHTDRSSTIHAAGYHDDMVMVGINLQI